MGASQKRPYNDRGKEFVGALVTSARVSMRKTIQIRYFAALREAAGRSEETVETQAQTPRALYQELAVRHGLKIAVELLRVSINDRFAEMQGALKDGDKVAFIPPVSGG